MPWYVQILHIEQEIPGSHLSALETVLETDVERAALLREKAAIMNALEKSAELEAAAADQKAAAAASSAAGPAADSGAGAATGADAGAPEAINFEDPITAVLGKRTTDPATRLTEIFERLDEVGRGVGR